MKTENNSGMLGTKVLFQVLSLRLSSARKANEIYIFNCETRNSTIKRYGKGRRCELNGKFSSIVEPTAASKVNLFLIVNENYMESSSRSDDGSRSSED